MRKMKRLEWVCDKKMGTETLTRGRPETLAFNSARYAHKRGGKLGILAIKSFGFVKRGPD